MYKVSIDLPKVNDSLSIKFSLMLIGTGRNQQEQPVYSKFTIGGVDYLKFSPHPFVTLDFNPKKKRNEEADWSKYRAVTLTQTMLIRFNKLLKSVLESIRIPDMFQTMDGKLLLNKERAAEHECGMWAGDKFIKLAPIVVEDNSSANPVLYEGIVLYVNSMDSFICLTYTEAEVLYEVLDRIDFQSLSMQLINGAMLMKNSESKKIDRTFTEVKEVEEDSGRIIKPKNPFEGLEDIDI